MGSESPSEPANPLQLAVADTAPPPGPYDAAAGIASAEPDGYETSSDWEDKSTPALDMGAASPHTGDFSTWQQEQQEHQQAGAATGAESGGDSGWRSDADVDDPDEVVSADVFTHVWSALCHIAQLCFNTLFGEPANDGAGAGAAHKRQWDGAGPWQPPVCCSRSCAAKHAATLRQKPAWKFRLRSGSSGTVVSIHCTCGQQHAVKGIREIGVGDVIAWREGGRLHYGLIRGCSTATCSVKLASWHVQRLAAALQLPAAGGAADKMEEYPLHASSGQRSFVLGRGHGDVNIAWFVDKWAAGEAYVVGSTSAHTPGQGSNSAARLFFQTAGRQGHAVRAVPPADRCPTYDTLGCECGCACLNPWALIGGSGVGILHGGCSNLAAVIAAAAQRARKLSGDLPEPGSLVWVLPGAASEVDAQLELGRVTGVHTVVDDSQDSLELPPAPQVWVEYERFCRRESEEGFRYQPSGEVARCPEARVKWVVDPEVLPRCIRVAGAAGVEGAGLPSSCPGQVVGSGSYNGSGGCAPSVNSAPSTDTNAEVLSLLSGSGGGGGSGRHGAAGGGGEPCLPEEGEEVSSGAGAGLPIRICDIFCGFGGLSLGLLQALPGARVPWACDLFGQALDTYAGCHPGARTFPEDVVTFLHNIRAGADGYPPKGASAHEWRVLVGGPPCQGFSKANKGDKAAKARKNVLFALFLTVLAELQWPFAIIENVTGLLSAGDMMQRVMQCLVSMGYQCSFRLLNAGSYGTAQHRRRVVLLAAKHGLPLPRHPAPTHVFEGAGGYSAAGTCTAQARRDVACRSVPLGWRANVEVPLCAPLPALCAADVIGDLPAELGDAYGPPACEARKRRAYIARLMRRGVAAGSRLLNHETWALQQETKERLEALPREGQPGWEGGAGAAPGPPQHPFRPRRAGDWRDWPQHLVPESLRGKEADNKTWGRFGRLTWRSHFATCLTCPQLNSDTTSTTVHPSADRPLSVREAARVQGVPDTVRFQGTIAQCYKQVGNAVPPPLAEAIGRELGKALRRAEEERRSP